MQLQRGQLLPHVMHSMYAVLQSAGLRPQLRRLRKNQYLYVSKLHDIGDVRLIQQRVSGQGIQRVRGNTPPFTSYSLLTFTKPPNYIYPPKHTPFFLNFLLEVTRKIFKIKQFWADFDDFGRIFDKFFDFLQFFPDRAFFKNLDIFRQFCLILSLWRISAYLDVTLNLQS